MRAAEREREFVLVIIIGYPHTISARTPCVCT